MYKTCKTTVFSLRLCGYIQFNASCKNNTVKNTNTHRTTNIISLARQIRIQNPAMLYRIAVMYHLQDTAPPPLKKNDNNKQI